MKKHMNQRGYALLIVLLTIIIFLSLSSVFISASLNHATQEKTVDQKNQAVVAAEMGTKYYSKVLENKINEEIKLVHNKFKMDVELIDQNIFKLMNNKANQSDFSNKCMNDYNEKKYSALFKCEANIKMKANYEGMVNNLISKKNEYIEKNKSLDGRANFAISEFILENEIKGEDQYKSNLSFKVTGFFDGNSYPLITNITINLPNFLDENKKIDIISEINVEQNMVEILDPPEQSLKKCPIDVASIQDGICDFRDMQIVDRKGDYNYIDLQNYINDIPVNKKVSLKISEFCNYIKCKGNTNLDTRAVTLFLSDMDVKNINKMSDSSIVINGTFEFKNANAAGSLSGMKIIAKSFSGSSANKKIENSTFAILGSKNSNGQIDGIVNLASDLNISKGSKMCLNLDYVIMNDFLKTNLVTSDGGVIYTFSNSNPKKVLVNYNKNVVTLPTFSSFLSQCGVVNNTVNKSFIRDNVIYLDGTFDLDVQYLP